jgi:hypothetical protein
MYDDVNAYGSSVRCLQLYVLDHYLPKELAYRAVFSNTCYNSTGMPARFAVIEPEGRRKDVSAAH